MSLNWFKGRKSLPAEKDVAREYIKIQHAEEASKRLFKDGKKLSDATVVAGRAATKVGSDFNTLTGENECGNILKKTMSDCGRMTQDKNQLIQKTLVDPMKKYNSIFPHLNSQIKSHEKCQQEYKRLQAKVDKLNEKEETGSNLVKKQNLKKDLTPVKDEFEAKHSMLLDEFPAFYNSRLQYLQPLFESLVLTQSWHHNELNKLFNTALNDLTNGEPERDLEEDVRETLEQIRALSITQD
uniref:bridging integrator 3-like n=1 Tax=Styela clava TaxID=7725 RepID=UPI001939C07D|nr:bridging integrator 3-like [Styela clava]